MAGDSPLRFVGVSLDCPDPAVLANFYLGLLEGELLWSNDDSAGVRVPGVILILSGSPATAHRPGRDPRSSIWI